MPEYSPLIVFFICLHLISLILLSILIYIILKTGSYITKWTLFQLCICLFILDITSLLTIIIHGDSLKDRAPDSLCIIQNKIISFIYCPLKLFPVALYFYLWFAVARFNYNLEQKYFWHISGIIWIISIVVNIYELNNNSKEKNWGVQSDTLFCKSIPTKTEWLSYLIPTTLYAVTSLIVTVHSSYTLWDRWRNFNQKQNRRTAIDLGYAVRLTVLSGVYSIILLFSLIPAVIKKVNHETGTLFTDFAPSIFGTILFMIFGTTKSAAIFLPCCYYAPPNDRKKQKSITSQQYSINIEHPMRHESIELDAISKQEESLGIETTFDTFSSKNTILD